MVLRKRSRRLSSFFSSTIPSSLARRNSSSTIRLWAKAVKCACWQRAVGDGYSSYIRYSNKKDNYALSHWDDLTRYAQNGLIEIDNNGVENAIRPTAIGKKNWLFIGHPEAGQRSAIIYTIIENCRKHGINPYEYLKDVLTQLPSMKITEVEKLLPINGLNARIAKAA